MRVIARILSTSSMLLLFTYSIAQLPTCSGSSASIIYFNAGGGNNNIYNYDISQPLSASNPSINTISMPTGGSALAVGDNINASAPSPTFYCLITGYCYYYNGSSWTNTNHLGNNAGGIGAGGGYIYGMSGGNVSQYNGTGNAISMPFVGTGVYGGDIIADCSGNYYMLKVDSPRILKKFSPVGTLLNSWVVTISIPTISSASYAIIGDTIYGCVVLNAQNKIFKGVINGSSTINFDTIPGSMSVYAGDMASCPLSGMSIVHASVDTLKYCDSGIMQVSASGGGPYNWTVLSGSASVNSSAALVNIHATGNALVRLSPGTGSLCGTGADTITVLVQPNPIANISSNSPICMGDSLQLHNASTSGATYNWTGPNSFSTTTAGSGRVNIQFADSGNYILTASVAYCSKTDTEHVVVKPIPVAPVTSSNSPVCAGDSLKLTGSTSTSGVSYGWVGPGTYNSTQQNPYRFPVALTDSGDYIFSVTLNGCSSKDTVHVSIQSPANPLAGSNSPLCISDSLKLTSSTVVGATYIWSGPGSFSSSLQNTYRLNVQVGFSGDYIITIMLNSCSIKDTVNVVVNPMITPTVSIVTNPSPVKPGQSATYTANPNNGGASPTWQWKKNGVNIIGATNSSYIYTPASHDTICVVMHSNATCPLPDTAKACNVAPLEVNELIGQNDEWLIWPNPVSNQLIIEGAGNCTSVKIFDLVGKEVYSDILQEERKAIDTRFWSTGIYFIQFIEIGGNHVTKKILKE